MDIIILLFLISILFITVKYVIKLGFNKNVLLIILSKIWWLRGFYFIVLYLYVNINMMRNAEDGSGYLLIPFVICGLAALLSMYRQTRKYGLYLFTFSFCFLLFILFPLIGIINSYNSGNANTEDIIGAIIFIAFGIFMGIFIVRAINKEN